jgi:hypothetical protein
MSESKASARRVTAAERRREAIRLRRAGSTYDSIGAALGVTRSTARKLVVGEFDRLNLETGEAAQELRTLEAARLDEIQEAIWPRAVQGHLGAIDRVLKVMERRARLLGLDAPTKIAPTDPSGSRQYTGAGLSSLLGESPEKPEDDRDAIH